MKKTKKMRILTAFLAIAGTSTNALCYEGGGNLYRTPGYQPHYDPYHTDTVGYAYDATSRATRLGITIAVSAAVIAAIVVIACNTGNSSHSGH